ncbi:hypothetical protein C7974DRAFT_59833 [Boeremia exigua]|uniref:uncharacterized protein n=1 Tax=Boeremia exigua TaxID=749465 RepID=UPI001E8E678C|nr:uncharacterized protein C7974DRAFT_59833 [Boeremia exigua]KAH6615133.1 hypothetical protein C7974DRAFT_59833 [Boeremia exigua]
MPAGHTPVCFTMFTLSFVRTHNIVEWSGRSPWRDALPPLAYPAQAFLPMYTTLPYLSSPHAAMLDKPFCVSKLQLHCFLCFPSMPNELLSILRLLGPAVFVLLLVELFSLRTCIPGR